MWGVSILNFGCCAPVSVSLALREMAQLKKQFYVGVSRGAEFHMSGLDRDRRNSNAFIRSMMPAFFKPPFLAIGIMLFLSTSDVLFPWCL